MNNKQYFIELLLAAYQKQIDLNQNDSIAKMEEFLSNPDSVPVLLDILNTPEIEDPFIKKACLTFLYQSVKKFLSPDLMDIIIVYIQQLFEVYKRETDFHLLVLIHDIFKLFIDMFSENMQFSIIFMNMLVFLLHNDLLDQAILLAKSILNHYTIDLTPEVFQMFSTIALHTFINFPGEEFFKDSHTNDDQVEKNVFLVIKSSSIFQSLYYYKKNSENGQILQNFDYSVYFIPLNLLVNIVLLGGYVHNITLRSYKKFWEIMAHFVDDFHDVYQAIEKNQLTPQLLEILMPANVNFTPALYQLFEKYYFQCANKIFSDIGVDEYIKSIPFSSISPYILNFKAEHANFLFMKEYYLTIHSVLSNINQCEHFQIYASTLKHLFTNHQYKKEIYLLFRKIFFNFLAKYKKNQNVIKITVALYLSVAIKKVPAIVGNDLDFLSQIIESCIQSNSIPEIYAALKCLRRITQLKFESYMPYSSFISHFIPTIQQLIISGIDPLYRVALEVYVNYLNHCKSFNLNFLLESGQIIKEKVPYIYYLLLSIYFQKSENYDSELINNFINESIPLLQITFFDMYDLDLSAYLSIFSCIFSCLQNNEQYFDVVWPTFQFHFSSFVEKVLPSLINETENILNINFLKDHYNYIFHMSSLIAQFSLYFCSDISKVYINHDNHQFLINCISSVWKIIPFLVTSNFTLPFIDTFSLTFEYLSKSISEFMDDQQLIEFVMLIYGIYNQEKEQYCSGLIIIIMVFYKLLPRLVRMNNPEIYEIINQIVIIYFEYITPFLYEDNERFSSKLPIFIDLIFENLPAYCLSIENGQNSPANLFLKDIYIKTHQFLTIAIDIENIDKLNPFHNISLNNFAYFNDLIEALVSAPGFTENCFWINLYLRVCENYSDDVLYYALDTFIKAIQMQSIPIELHDKIAIFAIEKLNAFMQNPNPNFLAELPNIIFLFHRLIFIGQNIITLNFVNENINSIIQTQNIFVNQTDSALLGFLKEDLASLYLCLACFNPNLDVQILSESIDCFVPSDFSEQENFLCYYLVIASQENYFQNLRLNIFASLVSYFSKPFSAQIDMIISKEKREEAISLFFRILQSGMPETMDLIQNLLQNKPNELIRINNFIQFYSNSYNLKYKK